MSQRFSRVTNTGSETHFSTALSGELECSRMTASPEHVTTFNAGQLVPIYYAEVLPHSTFDFSIDSQSVVRQMTILTPTMGSAEIDFYAFFVPNRVVNKSWQAVMGENYSGSWTASPVSLAPLYSGNTAVQIPVGSIADYYGFPTQQPMPAALLQLCNDLKFRGYCMIWNERFRDQNYQPPIPMSLLNIYEGFFEPDRYIGLKSSGSSPFFVSFGVGTSGTGSYGAGAVVDALEKGNDGFSGVSENRIASRPPASSSTIYPYRLDALSAPLYVNKLHDYFTSCLPSPQKGANVFVPATLNGDFAVVAGSDHITRNTAGSTPIHWILTNTSEATGQGGHSLGLLGTNSTYPSIGAMAEPGWSDATATVYNIAPSNLHALVESDSISISVDDIRMSSAIQQVYEQLARSGSRYREYVQGFFGLEVDDPFSDIPQYLGHLRRGLDLYQTAQTSPTVSGGTPQANLAAFGYTTAGGHLFTRTFIEHGYIHVFAVVRHKNLYPSYFAKDNLRLNFLDFYQPQLCNISEQPVWTSEINPFAAFDSSNNRNVFGYQEAWAEYRFEPSHVSGYMRPGIDKTLAVWNYADDFSSSLVSADGAWLRSNTQSVIQRTLAVDSTEVHQFKAQFRFLVDKELPMPTYSVPGLDIV